MNKIMKFLENITNYFKQSSSIKKEITILNNEMLQSKKNDIVLMKSDLLRQFDKCIEQKYRTQFQSVLFLSMCDEYFASGGNSFVHDIKDEFLRLPLKN